MTCKRPLAAVSGHRAPIVLPKLVRTAFALMLAAYGLDAACRPAHAQEAAQGLRLVTGNGYEPYSDESLPQGGMVTEIVRAALAAEGVSVEQVVFAAWTDGLEDVRTGRFDATFPYVSTPERERALIYSAPIFVSESTAFFRAGLPEAATTERMLEACVLCVPDGFAVAGNVRSASRIAGESAADCIGMIQDGRADAVVLPRLLGHSLVQRLLDEPDALAEGPTAVRRSSLHLVAARESPRGRAVVAAFDAGLRQLKASGAWESIVTRHLGLGALNWTRVGG